MTYRIENSGVEGRYILFKDWCEVFNGTLADCYAWIKLDKMEDAIFIY